ncbi:Urease accessory protein UreF [Cordyceps fumosorosea ARSEF 2679]|uniref:Urease accessory protein UreF n=1 Tax=Cordyceps fumosorosea (strain ARSEF 2679) TaxID=1081104 RepID=A0A162JR12_CORFA|nr:Urease accessory protein UreF [Cordyceps fumosorosea ARSEF 2679]OAA72522.1 Urease accessory protein UreF [Cordyceps fumosorosea ARSEF 2679]
MSPHQPNTSLDAIEDEIAQLEAELHAARIRLRDATTTNPKQQRQSPNGDDAATQLAALTIPPQVYSPTTSSTHFLLLLSDSALPVGAFAFSSGLESFLAHAPRGPSATFSAFLPLSLASFAATTLPFALAAHRDPSRLASLDDQQDAAVVCTVGRRASTAQGRALLSVWERSLRSASFFGDAVDALRDFSALLRECGGGSTAVVDGLPPLASGHYAPLFGAVCAAVGLSVRQAAYVFMLGHVKALVSAAVRASMFGPYQAQKVLAGAAVQDMMNAVIEREWDTPVEEAGQSVPVMDLWIGRHEVLYSRIFNS